MILDLNNANRCNRLKYKNQQYVSPILCWTLRELNEFILLFIVDLLIKAEFLDDVQVPFLLHLEVETVLRFGIVLFLHLEELLYGAVEGLAE